MRTKGDKILGTICLVGGLYFVVRFVVGVVFGV